MSPPTVSVPKAPAAAAGSAKTDLAALLDEPTSLAWYRRPALWAGVLLLALAAAGLGWWQQQRMADAALSYTAQTVARGNLTLTVTVTVTANGTLQPTRAVNIGSELSGSVLRVNVDVNDRVKKGQVVAVPAVVHRPSRPPMHPAARRNPVGHDPGDDDPARRGGRGEPPGRRHRHHEHHAGERD